MLAGVEGLRAVIMDVGSVLRVNGSAMQPAVDKPPFRNNPPQQPTNRRVPEPDAETAVGVCTELCEHWPGFLCLL